MWKRRQGRRLPAPRAQALGAAAGRVGLGAAMTLLPATAWRQLVTGEPGPAATVAVRMLGVRDLVLGLGVLLAARERDPSLRRWVQAGALVDVGDAAAVALSPAVRPSRRVLVATVAGLAGLATIDAARRL